MGWASKDINKQEDKKLSTKWITLRCKILDISKMAEFVFLNPFSGLLKKQTMEAAPRAIYNKVVLFTVFDKLFLLFNK